MGKEDRREKAWAADERGKEGGRQGHENRAKVDEVMKVGLGHLRWG